MRNQKNLEKAKAEIFHAAPGGDSFGPAYGKAARGK